MSYPVTIQDFRATRRTFTVADESGVKSILTYWVNAESLPNLDEALHIKCGPNENYYLEIANMSYRGVLQDLEEVLYQWALDEDWFE